MSEIRLLNKATGEELEIRPPGEAAPTIGEVPCRDVQDFFRLHGVAGVDTQHCYAYAGDIDVNHRTGGIDTGNNAGWVSVSGVGNTPHLEKFTTYLFTDAQGNPIVVTVTHIHID